MCKRHIEEWEMLPTKGSEKEMTETVTTNDVVVTSYVDNEGDEIAVGALVHVAPSVERGEWDADKYEWTNKRAFDFGTVSSLNEDGTVSVDWFAASCGCNGDASSRVEKGADLTVTNSDAVELYYKGLDDGEESGVKEFKSELLEFLELPSLKEIEQLEEKAFQYDQLNK